MKRDVPSAQEYSAQTARFAPMTVVDIRSEQSGVAGAYDNHVLLNVNAGCMRLSVFEGQYRWHRHPDSDELFLVASGELQIKFEDGASVSLREWQSIVVPASVVHRTRAIGRTVNVTFERQNALTIFVEPTAK